MINTHQCEDQGWKYRETYSAYKTGCTFDPLHYRDIPVVKKNAITNLIICDLELSELSFFPISQHFKWDCVCWMQSFLKCRRQFKSAWKRADAHLEYGKPGLQQWEQKWHTCQNIKCSLMIVLTASLLQTSLFRHWQAKSWTFWMLIISHLFSSCPQSFAF